MKRYGGKKDRKITVHRKGYYRKNGTYVKPTTYTTADRGNKGRTPENEKWFDPEAPLGWRKDMPAEERRKVAYDTTKKQVKDGIYSASSSSDLNLLVARRLQALANVTTDKETKKKQTRTRITSHKSKKGITADRGTRDHDHLFVKLARNP